MEKFLKRKLVFDSSSKQEAEIRTAQKVLHVLARIFESTETQQEIKNSWPFYLQEGGDPTKQIGRFIS